MRILADSCAVQQKSRQHCSAIILQLKTHGKKVKLFMTRSQGLKALLYSSRQ